MQATRLKRTAALAALLMIASALMVPMMASAGPVLTMSVANENPQTAAPGGSVTFNVSISNNGDATAIVNLSLSGTPSTWTAQLSSSQVTVSVGNTVTVYLTVGVPNNATADNVGKAIVVVGTYETSPGTNQTKQVTTTTKVSQVYIFSMSVDGAFNKDIAPGASGTYTLNLSQVSQGNGVNQINLTPTGEQPDKLILSYSANPVTLQPFSFSTVTVTVFVPENTLAKQYSYTISGNSQGGGSAQTASIIVNVTQTWGVSLSSADPVRYLNPDSLTTFNIDVNNTGNKADTFDISAVTFMSSSTGWTETHTSSVGPISPRTSLQATVQVYAPSTATYPTSMQLQVNFTSQSNSTIKRSITVTAVVNKVNGTYISANPFINTSDPGGTASFKIVVKNTGNGQSTLDLTVPSFPSHLTPSLDTSSVELTAGASVEVNLTVSVNKDAPVGDSNLIVKSSVRDGAASSNFTVIVRVNQMYNLSVNPSGSYSQRITPGGKAVYGLTVKNTGNGNDTITMSNGTAPAGLTTYFDRYSVTLGPGESISFNATVEVAKGTAAGSVALDLKGTSSSGKSASTSIIVIVDQSYEVSATTTAAFNNTQPGKSATYAVMVRNLGSGNDTFSITAGGDNPAWVSLSNSSISLTAGNAANITVTVNVPTDAKKGNVTTTVTTTSDSNSSVKASVNLTTVIDQTYGVQAWLSPASAEIRPGESGKYGLIIKNTGNAKDTFFVNLSKNPNNWGALDLASPFVQLDSGTFFNANLTITVPSDAAVAVITTEVMATSQGSSAVSGTAQAVTNVTAIYNMELLVNNINASGEPTDTVLFDVRVKNTGNAQDTFNLDITGEKRSWATLNVSSVSLGYGESRLVGISVLIPDSEQPGNWTIAFKATSLGNTSKTSSVNLTIRVKPKHDLDLSSGDFQVRKKADPGTSAVFKVNVTNKGPEQDTVDLSLSGENLNWATLSQDSVVLSAGAYYIVDLTVVLPSNANPTSFVITVTGKLKSTANRTKTLDFTLSVGQIYKIEVSSAASENETAPGGTVTYIVRIRNTGTGNDTIQLDALEYGTWVTFSKTSVILQPGASENVTVSVAVPSKPLPAMGDYNITIQGKSIGNESVKSSVVLVLTVTQIYGVKASTNVSVSYTDPGQSAYYEITVKNEGNGKDSFSLTKSGDKTDWVTFSSSSVTLTGGQSTSVNLIVQVPANAFAQNITILVNVKSQGDLGVQQNLSLTTTINQLYGLELSASETSKELKTAASAYYNLTVKNSGNSNDTMLFEAVGSRTDWVTFNVTSVLLGPQASATVQVTVTPPWSVPYDKMSGTYTNLIKVTSKGYSFATSNLTLTTKVDIRYGLTVSWDATAKTTGPGGKATFNATITNTGNIDDLYLLTAQTYTTWVSYDQNNVSILAGNSITVMMTVSVPVGQANQDYNINLEVKSLGNDSIKAAPAQTIKVTVSERFGVQVTSEDLEKDCGQGASVVYTLKVKNTGNVLEDIDLKVMEGNYKDWAVLSISTAKLGEKEETEMTVTVNVPSGQSAGAYAINLKAEVRGHADIIDGTKQVTLTTTVGYGVELTTKETKKKGKANELVTFNVTVKNKGTGNDTFDLTILDPYSSWLENFDFDLFELAKDKTKVVKVTLRIDKDAKMDNYIITLKVTSDGDAARSATVPLTVEVSKSPALLLECSDIDQTIRPGQSVVYTVRLTNDGNGQDTFKLKVQEGENTNWASISKETSLLREDQYEELAFTVTLPTDARAGTYNHSLKVWSQDEEGVFATLTFKTKVEEVYNFQITAEEVSMDGEPDELVGYTLRLENLGNAVDTYELQVKDLPSNWGYNVSLETITVNAKSKLTFTFWVWITGDYKKAESDSYSFTIRLISRGNDTIEKSLALTTVVTQVYGMELTPDINSARVEIDPYGDDEDFTINIKNTGNGEDTVTFKVKRFPAGWSASYFTFSPTAVTIMPGNTTTKQVIVRLSATSIESDPGSYDFDIVATSKNGDEWPPLRLYVDVIKGEIQQLTTSDVTISKTSAEKGQTITFEVTIRNVGDSDMKNVIVTLYANRNAVKSTTISTKIEKNKDAVATLEWQPDQVDTYEIKLQAKYGTQTEELKMTKKISVTEAGAGKAITSQPWFLPLIAGVLILIVIGAIAMALRRKPAPAPEARRPIGPAPAKPPAEDEEEEEEGEEGGAAPKPPGPPPPGALPAEGKPRIVRIRCPKCQTTKDITSPVRPLKVNCDKCNAVLMLKK